MAVLSDEQLAGAELRGADVLLAEPRARSVIYDIETGRVVIDLVSGCTFSIPTTLIQDLQDAPADALSDIVVDGRGLNLHWPALDVDLFVPALLSGTFGTKAWMSREMARVANQPIPPKKAVAARASSTTGGRLRKGAAP